MNEKKNIQAQKWAIVIGLALMLIKFAAYRVTGSNAILSDALESIVNVVAGFFSLYALTFSAHPKDPGHPYGHGKIEFLSAGVEGFLIFVAGMMVVGKAIYNIFYPETLQQMDVGIYLASIAGIVNYVAGQWLQRRGERTHSLPLVAGGKHLKSDAYTTVGMVAGLIILNLTNMLWIDQALAIGFGLFIAWTGSKIIMQAISRIMDETDIPLIQEMAEILQKNRRPAWIDVHNLRTVHYGAKLHVDAHVTLPRYYDLQQTHQEMEKIASTIENTMLREVEFSIHPDPCVPSSCRICQVENCPVRESPLEEVRPWNYDTVVYLIRHQ